MYGSLIFRDVALSCLSCNSGRWSVAQVLTEERWIRYEVQTLRRGLTCFNLYCLQLRPELSVTGNTITHTWTLQYKHTHTLPSTYCWSLRGLFCAFFYLSSLVRALFVLLLLSVWNYLFQYSVKLLMLPSWPGLPGRRDLVSQWDLPG